MNGQEGWESGVGGGVREGEMWKVEDDKEEEEEEVDVGGGWVVARVDGESVAWEGKGVGSGVVGGMGIGCGMWRVWAGCGWVGNGNGR